MSQQEMEFNKEIIKKLKLKYLLYFPKNYSSSVKKWPLVLYLHGAGERGEILEHVKWNGIPRLAEDEPDFQFMALSPLCPNNSSWQNQFDAIDKLLYEVQEKYNIDERKIYVTGISMGGYGTWDIALMFPERFAAIVPICGGTSYPELIGLLKDLPIWAFHGAKDDIILPEETRVLIDFLKQYNPNIKYTEYPEGGHDAWTETYDNPEMYRWLLSQERKPN